jgi:hypothetical protein
MAQQSKEYAIQSAGVRALSKLVEESTRATGDSVKFFIEPTPGAAFSMPLKLTCTRGI